MAASLLPLLSAEETCGIQHHDMSYTGKKGKFVANAMKRVAAGSHLPTPWLFEPAKRPDDKSATAWAVGRSERLAVDRSE